MQKLEEDKIHFFRKCFSDFTSLLVSLSAPYKQIADSCQFSINAIDPAADIVEIVHKRLPGVLLHRTQRCAGAPASS